MTKTFLSLSVIAFGALASENTVTIPAGAWVSVRVNQQLSSDRNQAGDSFTATLAEPIIANGMVVARRGQTLAGRVAETSKGGRIKGTSRLGIEIVELSLVDGQNIPIRTQLVESSAGTSRGRDATAVATTTGVGAAIGAAAAGASGAGLGALAGAGASLIGVFSTKGRATEIYPEDLVTFRTLSPVEVRTDQAAHAFQPVRQEDYTPTQLQPRMSQQRTPFFAPSPFLYGPFWGPGWGPGFRYGWGPRIGFWGGGGRGFRRWR